MHGSDAQQMFHQAHCLQLLVHMAQLCTLDHLSVRDAGAQVTTVDKYQGQQNEYVLLSLVRTRAVGHVRDVRRLVVAMSRARLGLYIFGRLPLFANCYELQPTMAQLMQRPTQLALQPTEYWQVS